MQYAKHDPILRTCGYLRGKVIGMKATNPANMTFPAPMVAVQVA
jgi:hypothetical protein